MNQQAENDLPGNYDYDYEVWNTNIIIFDSDYGLLGFQTTHTSILSR